MSEAAVLAPNATVVRRQMLAGCLFRLFVRPDWAVDQTPWQPGQFVRLAAPAEGSDFKKEGRAYSFAGVEGDVFEFYVVEVPDGVQTPRLKQLEPGDRIWCEHKIQGHFTLANNPVGPELWMIATGAGIAPYMAMIRHDQSRIARYERVTIVHQVRELAHLSYGNLLAEWALDWQTRRYIPIVSRPHARFLVKDGHCPLFGRVPEALWTGRLEAVAETQIVADRSVVMLCGNPDMIKDVRELLEQRGLAKHMKRTPGQIVSERYW